MIKRIETQEEIDYLDFLSTKDEFGSVLYSLYYSYRQLDKHIGFYIQTERQKPVAVFAQLGNVLTICAQQMQYEEFFPFVEMLGEITIIQGVLQTVGPIAAHYRCYYEKKQILCCERQPDNIDTTGILTVPNVGKLYDLLAQEETQFRLHQERTLWIWDQSYRFRHGFAVLAAIEGYLATASIGYLGQSSGMLTNVLVKKEERGKGYAKKLVRFLTNQLVQQGKKAYLLCEDDLASFYQALFYQKQATAMIAWIQRSK